MSTSLHRNTPSLVAFDLVGWRSVVSLICALPSGCPTARIRRQVYGASGLMLEQWDPRLHTLKSREPLTEANQVSVYSLSGTLIRRNDVDAGMRLMLPAPSGQLLHAWDGRVLISATTTMLCSVRWRCSNKPATKRAPDVSNAWCMPRQHPSTAHLTAAAVWYTMPTRRARRCTSSMGSLGKCLDKRGGFARRLAMWTGRLPRPIRTRSWKARITLHAGV